MSSAQDGSRAGVPRSYRNGHCVMRSMQVIISACERCVVRVIRLILCCPVVQFTLLCSFCASHSAVAWSAPVLPAWHVGTDIPVSDESRAVCSYSCKDKPWLLLLGECVLQVKSMASAVRCGIAAPSTDGISIKCTPKELPPPIHGRMFASLACNALLELVRFHRQPCVI